MRKKLQPAHEGDKQVVIIKMTSKSTIQIIGLNTEEIIQNSIRSNTKQVHFNKQNILKEFSVMET